MHLDPDMLVNRAHEPVQQALVSLDAGGHVAGVALEREEERIGRRVFHSLLGYAAAIGMKTIPREMTRREPTHIRARNLGQAFHLLPDGRQLPIPKGTLLFDGPCKFAGVATVPNYGFGMKVYPFAGTESGKMHLRISAMGVTETLVSAYISSTYRDAVAFVILIAVLLVKPTGLFGSTAVEKV